MIEVLCLGAGVQSSVLVMKSIKGELPKLEHVIFADTEWEPKAVYEQMDFLERECEKAGIVVHRVGNGSVKDDALRYQKGYDGSEEKRQVQRGVTEDGKTRWGSMPLFVLNPDGSFGQIRRQCTYEYKISCIEMCIRRKVLGLKPRQRAPKDKVVRQWYGISYDERTRQRDDFNVFTKNWYPLIENYTTRLMCLDWFKANGLKEAPRSACIGCPYHSNFEWIDMKQNRPEDWQEAVEFDELIRDLRGMRGKLFLHSQRVPLKDVKLWTKHDENQLPLFSMEDECSGMCGV